MLKNSRLPFGIIYLEMDVYYDVIAVLLFTEANNAKLQ